MFETRVLTKFQISFPSQIKNKVTLNLQVVEKTILHKYNN